MEDYKDCYEYFNDMDGFEDGVIDDEDVIDLHIVGEENIDGVVCTDINNKVQVINIGKQGV